MEQFFGPPPVLEEIWEPKAEEPKEAREEQEEQEENHHFFAEEHKLTPRPTPPPPPGNKEEPVRREEDAQEQKQEADPRFTVVVIGAGCAGLSAAKQLIGEDDVDVVVLEARPRVGGRIHTVEMSDGSLVDLGASFIHGCYEGNPVYQLARELKVEVDTQARGYSQAWAQDGIWLDASRRVSPAQIYPVFALAHEIYLMLAERARRLAQDGASDVAVRDAVREVLPEGLRRLRSLFPKKRLSARQARMLDCVMVLFYGYAAPFDEIGIIHQADDVDAAGGQPPGAAPGGGGESGEKGEHVERREEEEDPQLPCAKPPEDDDVRDGMVVQGYMFLIDFLRAGVRDIRLNSVVTRVRWLREDNERGGAIVYLRDGTQIPCANVICTVPVSVLKGLHPASRIEFLPPLPEEKRRAIDLIGMGVENKCLMRFDVNFWGHLGPYFNCTDQRFRFINMDAFGKPRLLAAHINPPFSIEMASLEDSQVVHEVMGVLRDLFPKKVTTLQEYVVTNWLNDPFAMGSYSYMGKGTLFSHLAALREPFGCISFAGEATSVYNAQCVHGAYVTGLQAGLEVLEQIKVRRMGGWNPQKIFCVCRQEWDGHALTTQCDTCRAWFHNECVGLKGELLEHQWWVCPSCAPSIPKCRLCQGNAGGLLECATCGERICHGCAGQQQQQQQQQPWNCGACAPAQKKLKLELEEAPAAIQ